MSDFFRSEQVQNTIMELAQLQQQLVTETPYLPMMNDDQKRKHLVTLKSCLLYTSPSPRDLSTARMPSSA